MNTDQEPESDKPDSRRRALERSRRRPAPARPRPLSRRHAHRQSGRHHPARAARAALCRQNCLRGHAPDPEAAQPLRHPHAYGQLPHAQRGRPRDRTCHRAQGRRAHRRRQRRGNPGIADPGGQIAAAAIAAGVPVFPIPGAERRHQRADRQRTRRNRTASSDENAEQFTFHGFLPAKEGQRRTTLEALKNRVPHVPILRLGNDAATPQIFYEAPHRILATLADIESIFGGTQHVVVARELTKLHEEFLRGPVSEVRTTLAARATVRGEFVLLFVPAAAAPPVTPRPPASPPRSAS